jgi:hypothetical protein
MLGFVVVISLVGLMIGWCIVVGGGGLIVVGYVLICSCCQCLY